MRVALIGAGRMGLFHGQTLAQRLPGVTLVTVADPAATGLPPALGPARLVASADEVLDDPSVDAVVIAAPAPLHADLVVAAASAGKAVFCEKPASLTLDDLDRVIDATAAAGVVLQVGFNRRFDPGWRAARALIDDGTVGTPRLLRSMTRDPGGFDPSRVPPCTIFLETLIHDFDTLRFLNPGARAVSVFAVADALVEPAWADRGLLDTAVVTVRFSNGAIGVAEACFEAAYGYDVRGEVLGSGGMVTTGDGRATTMTFAGSAGRVVDTARGDQALFGSAYVAELAAFTTSVREKTPAVVTGPDARAALEIALAARESARTGQPVPL
jgi:myo-inositol 2-dehydrogenase / D-chiro-inositol 1-dehydrogenase